jgi:hypothetical protein
MCVTWPLQQTRARAQWAGLRRLWVELVIHGSRARAAGMGVGAPA